MLMYERIKEQSDLAHFYAQDGAYHSAARVLTDLAAEVRAHAERNTAAMAEGGGDPKTVRLIAALLAEATELDNHYNRKSERRAVLMREAVRHLKQGA